MRFSFDGFDRYEVPVLTLCNPNFTELYVVVPLHLPELTLRFNAISEMTFTVCERDEQGNPLPYYDLISKNRLIHMDGFGYWVITDTEESSEGGLYTKEVNCYSYEYMLSVRNVDLDAGTYQFYDFMHPEDTLLGRVIRRTPSWSIGEVSDSLMSKYRTFELPEESVYSFLTNDAAEAYEAIFIFDTENRRINAYDTTDALVDTDIVFTWDNLMKSVSIAETDDTVTTALDVYGSGTFNVNRVNPLGTPTIYRFDYFADQMTPSLWTKVKTWQDAVHAQIMGQEENNYRDLLQKKKQLYADALALAAESSELLAYAESGKQIQDINIPYSLSPSSQSGVTGFYGWVNSQNQETLKAQLLAATSYPPIDFNAPPAGTSGYVGLVTAEDVGIAQALVNIYACNRIITYNNGLIANLNNQLDSLDASMEQINGSLAFASYFTAEELLELDKFIFGNTYTNEYYVLSDIMTSAEVQDLCQELYEQGRATLERISQPNYTFDLEAVNFLFNKAYEPFIDQVQLGCVVNAEVRDGVWVSPLLLEISYSYESPDDFSLTWGNRFRLQSAEWTWAELNDEVTKTSGGVSANFSDMIKPVRSGQYAEVQNFITSALNAATNNIIAGNNQDMLIDQHGLLGRKAVVDENGNVVEGEYDDEQIKIINNLLCFTDDNWLTTKTALGRIDLGDGNYTWGLVAESIFGELIAGDRLYISNEGGTFMVDGNGATLLNSSFAIQNETGANSLGRIIANATDGFKLQTRSSDYANTTWGETPASAIQDQITLGMDGSVTINGSLVAVETVGGWKNEANQLGYGTTSFFAQLGSGSTPSASAYAFSAGTVSGSTKSPRFSVTYDGRLTATNASISGAVTATSGSFSNVTISGSLNCSGATFSGGSFQNISASGVISATTLVASSGYIGGFTITSNSLEYYYGGATYGIFNGTYPDVRAPNMSCTQIDFAYAVGGNVTGYLYMINPRDIYAAPNIWWASGTRQLFHSTYLESSIRYKTNVVPIEEEWKKIYELEPIIYTLKSDEEQRRIFGFIAEDVYDKMPNMVFTVNDASGNKYPDALDYAHLTVPIIKALQDINERLIKHGIT